jgi:hypothetical protein
MSDGFYYRKGPNPEMIWPVPVGSGTVVEIGDILKLSTGKAVVMVTSTDGLDFIGTAASAHASTDASGTISVYMPLPFMVFEYPLDAATDITVGDALRFNTKQKLNKSTTNAIATAYESKLQATTIRCVFRMPAATSGHVRLGTGEAS